MIEDPSLYEIQELSNGKLLEDSPTTLQPDLSQPDYVDDPEIRPNQLWNLTDEVNKLPARMASSRARWLPRGEEEASRGAWTGRAVGYAIGGVTPGRPQMRSLEVAMEDVS